MSMQIRGRAPWGGAIVGTCAVGIESRGSRGRREEGGGRVLTCPTHPRIYTFVSVLLLYVSLPTSGIKGKRANRVTP